MSDTCEHNWCDNDVAATVNSSKHGSLRLCTEHARDFGGYQEVLS